MSEATAPAAPYDLLVVGGGVNGCGIARDAAGRGLKVLLVEQADLASATSSSSSKLIHGGLRYLEYYEFRLVREALGEREVLLRSAPHIVWPVRFVLPHHDGLRPAWVLRVGLFLYDHIGGRKRLPTTRTLDLRQDKAGEPLVDGLTKGFEYSDCWVDDARLVALLAVDAAERGATIRTRTRLTGARREGGLWTAQITDGDGAAETVSARALVNAAGPWVDKVLASTGRNAPAGHHARLVKGSHLVFPRLYDGPQCYTLQSADGRVVFTIPYETDFTLVGTTDEPFDGDPAHITASDAEAQYLCGVLADYFKTPLMPSMAKWSYAGVRPLADSGQENASAVTRDYVFDLDTDGPPRLSVFGGKITTFRRLAEHALRDLGKVMGFSQKSWTEGATLPGGDIPDAAFEAFRTACAGRWPWLPPAVLTRLAHAYGSRIGRVLGDAAQWADLGRDFGAGLSEREAIYLRDHEWATAAQDVLWRRSKLGLHMTAAETAVFTEWFEG
ncbi:glycerol-3-phosphate dehydrogenase [soil metagenome]